MKLYTTVYIMCCRTQASRVLRMNSSSKGNCYIVLHMIIYINPLVYALLILFLWFISYWISSLHKGYVPCWLSHSSMEWRWNRQSVKHKSYLQANDTSTGSLKIMSGQSVGFPSIRFPLCSPKCENALVLISRKISATWLWQRTWLHTCHC